MNKITTPRGEVAEVRNSSGSVTVKLTWNASFAARFNEQYSRAQKFLDSEILRGCAPLVPFRTGMLQKSGTLGTVVGSGEVRWIAPYASGQYYKNRMGSNGEPQRGGYWFERWKAANGAAAIAKVKKMAGGGG